MATARDVISAALRLLSVTPSGQAPSAEDASDGLTALNSMMSAFPSMGIGYRHVTMTLEDVFPIPDALRAHVEAMLAVWIAPEYGIAPSPIVMQRDDMGRRALQAAHWQVETADIDSAVINRPFDFVRGI